MAEALYTRCRNGHEFESPFQLLRQTFESVTRLVGEDGSLTWNCPFCGVEYTLSKETMFFREEE